jgi:hypothetical protein
MNLTAAIARWRSVLGEAAGTSDERAESMDHILLAAGPERLWTIRGVEC